MSNKNDEINDDEIRIVSSEIRRTPRRKKKGLVVIGCGVIAVLIICGFAFLFFSTEDIADNNEADYVMTVPTKKPDTSSMLTDNPTEVSSRYAERRDTIVDGVELIILTPINASPVLEIGNDVLNDSTAVLIAQAADIRSDNGEIVGSFVFKGDLYSKGEAKAGFCSIVNGEIFVGVADATPMLEQALTSEGYFFRQYPLVVAGQIVENKPKGKSIRKALAEIDGRISVITSRNRISFHDFSKALIGAGVRNAIYLVGGKSYGRYVDPDGKVFSFGTVWYKDADNVNYIVWR